MSEWIPDRLPEDLDSERSLLSTLCAPGNEQTATEIVFDLSSDDFVHPGHKAIFAALVDVLEHHQEVSALTLKDSLAQAGELGHVGGFSSLVEILQGQEVSRPRVLADILQRKRKLRELIRMGARLVREAANEEQTPDAIVEAACSDLASMTQRRGESGPVAVGTVTDAVLEQVMAEASGKRIFGARTGFYRFDGITRGFKPGQLIVLAARPGVGKSTLARNWALGIAQRSAVPFFSLEMDKEEITRCLLTDMSSLDLREIQADDLPHLARAKYDLDTLPILIDDRAGTTVRQIRSKVERIQARQKVGLVIVDYLQLITTPGSAKQNEAVRIGEISRELKLMAKDCKIPVMVLSQLNREVEKRQSGKPQLSDLRDSGCIEQDADLVIFIHRKIIPSLPQELQDKTGELHIAKHRGGPCGSVPLIWDGALSRYKEQERETGCTYEPEYRPGRQQDIPFEEAV